jgi:NedA-like, galactose-binding domain
MPLPNVSCAFNRRITGHHLTRASLGSVFALLAFVSISLGESITSRPPDQIGPNSRVWIVKPENPPAAQPNLNGRGAARKARNVGANADQDAEASASEAPTGSRIEEIVTGMNYWDGEKWTESQASFDVTPGAFVAPRLQYIVSIGHQINAPNAINILTRDGITIRSTPVALALYDRASGASIIIGAITNSTGVLVSSNRVVFENAFHGPVAADLVYTIEKGTFEQDAIIRTRLDPADYNLPRDTTCIQVLTEIFEAPVPEKIRRPLYVEEREAVRNQMATPDIVDETLGWGEFVLGTGRAFNSEFDNSPTNAAASVSKEIRTIDNRRFIIESLEYSQVKSHIEALPAAAQEAALRKPAKLSEGRTAYAAIPKPAAKMAKAEKAGKSKELLRAKQMSAVKRKGLVIDYTAVAGNTLSAPVFFAGDTTYFINGAVICNGAVTIEAGTTLKYKHPDGAGSGYLKINNTLTCKTTSYRPATFTAATDPYVGESVATGDILTDGYANPALWFSSGTPQLTNLRFRFCQEAVRFESSSGTAGTLSHAQFVSCVRGIVITGCGCGCATPIVNNSLFAKVSYPIQVSRSQTFPKFFHCTVDTPSTGSYLASASFSSVCSFYNSIIANGSALTSGPVTLSGDYNGFSFYYNQQFGTHAFTIPYGSSIFTAVGAANYYLPPNSVWRSAGTTIGINNALLTQLAARTVDPPILLPPSSYPSGLILLPQAQGDSSAFSRSLGYHYDKLDYLISQLSLGGSGSTALLTNGVAVGVYGLYGFALTEQGAVVSEGGPLSMNRLAFYPAVQEQTNLLNNLTSTANSSIFNVSGAVDSTANILKPVIRMRFTDFPMMGLQQRLLDSAVQARNLNTVALMDCWLRGVNLSINADSAAFPQNSIPFVSIRNNLLERGRIAFTNGLYTVNSVSYDNPISVEFYNNLFWQGNLALTFNANGTSPAYSPTWNFQDNLFDTTNGLALAGNSISTVTRSWNAFFNTSTSGQLSCNPNSPNTDKQLTTLTYTTGPDGSPWYVGSAVPANLLEHLDTSRSAAAAGLYHYTVRPDQQKAGLATPPDGSIGWHHVALTSENLAPNKYATQSSTANGGVPSRAVDGNTAGSFSVGSVSSTASELQPWWQLDLGESRSIDNINIFSRTDCCQLNNFYVFVSDDPFASTSWSSTQTQSGVSTFYFPGTVTSSTAIAIGRTGRYIRIQLPVTTSLSLAEVQVKTASSPSEVDGDTLPDYFEDRDGNGTYELTDLSDWQNPFTDGTGMDDGWEVNYFAQISVDPYGDLDGDGYGNLEEYQNGTNPLTFNSPPKSVTSVQVLHESGNPAHVVVTWVPGASSVVSYTISRTVDAVTTTYTVAAGTTSWTDTSVPAGSSPTYSVTLNYSSGSAPPSPSGNADSNPLLAVDPEIVRGPTPSDPTLTPLRIILGGLVPPSVSAIRVHKYVSPLVYNHQYGDYDWALVWYAGDHGWFPDWPGVAYDNYFDVPIGQFVNGSYQIPVAQLPEWCAYYFQTQPIGSDGRGGVVSYAGFARNVPFMDGSAVLKDNLSFILRAGEAGDANDSDPAIVNFQANIDYAAVNPIVQHMDISPDLLTELAPFNDNWFMKNWAYDTDFDPYPLGGTTYYWFWWNKNIGSYGGYSAGQLEFQFDGFSYVNSPTGNAALLNSQLPNNGPIYLSVGTPSELGLYGFPSDDAGLSWNEADQSTHMASSHANFFGLLYQSVRITDSLNPLAVQYNLTPGGSYADPHPNDYSEYFQSVTAPALTTVGYYFAQMIDPTSDAVETITPMPNDPNFTTAQTTPLIVTAVGKPASILGWAKQQISNGSSTKFAYLGQYFDPTSVSGAILSEYGDFFPMQPGQFTLNTKSDAGQHGQCTVYAVSLNVDANHDGIMDLTYGGPDTTSPSTPMRFWVNNDNDGTGVGQDTDAKTVTPDYTYGTIRSQRGLEDFARLWISGLPALSADYTVTLTCSSLAGSPALNLYAAESAGGTLYLTDTTTAQSLVGHSKIATISSTSGYTFPSGFFDGSNKYFIFEGAGIGQGQFTLAIYHGGIVIAESQVWLDLRDVKAMYQRAGATPYDGKFSPPYSQAGSPYYINNIFNESVLGYLPDDKIPFKQALDETPQCLVFVHGWNMDLNEYTCFSETMYKRLYWQGYRGRFCAFRWATLTALNSYNTSEFRAWKYGVSLKAYVESLKAGLPGYSMSVAAHSMGNVVMGSALSRGLTVDNYVLMQAAVPAGCYDSSTAVNSYQMFLDAESSHPTPDLATAQGYRGFLANVSGNLVNFFNPLDFALATGNLGTLTHIPFLWWQGVSWENNEVNFKPDHFNLKTLYYNYVPTAPTGQQGQLLDSYYGLLHYVTDPHEMMSLIARPRSKAVGALQGVAGPIRQDEVDMHALFGFAGNRDEHSAQFNWTIQRLGGPDGFYDHLNLSIR